MICASLNRSSRPISLLVRSNSKPGCYSILGGRRSWSIGSYWKKRAIDLAFELLTQHFAIPTEKLYATVYSGNQALGIPPDTESREHLDQGWSRRRTDSSSEKKTSGVQPGRSVHVVRAPRSSSTQAMNTASSTNLAVFLMTRGPATAEAPARQSGRVWTRQRDNSGMADGLACRLPERRRPDATPARLPTHSGAQPDSSRACLSANR